MERSDAARLLGVPAGASIDAIRIAYRERIRTHHPDHAGPGATDAASAINEAYEVLRQVPEPVARSGAEPVERPAPRTGRPASPSPGPADVVLLDDDSMGFSFPADEVFDLLHDVANRLGDVTYADPDAGLLEVRLQFTGLPACSVVLSLQGRADRVEAFSTIQWERRSGVDLPADDAVVSLLIHSIRERLQDRGRRTSAG